MLLTGPTLEVTIFLERPDGAAPGPTGETISVEELNIPEKARAAFQKGLQELKEKKRPRHSIPHFRKAIQLHAGYAEAYAQVGRVYLPQEQYDEARQVLEQGVAANPGHARADTLLGLLYRSRGELDRAVAAFKKEVEADNAFWLAHFELASSLLARRRIAEAYPHAQRAHELNPEAVSTHVLVYNLCILRGELEEALAELEEFLQTHPESPWAAQARLQRDRLRQELSRLYSLPRPEPRQAASSASGPAAACATMGERRR